MRSATTVLVMKLELKCQVATEDMEIERWSCVKEIQQFPLELNGMQFVRKTSTDASMNERRAHNSILQSIKHERSVDHPSEALFSVVRSGRSVYWIDMIKSCHALYIRVY